LFAEGVRQNALGGHEHDARKLRNCLWCAPCARNLLQFTMLLFAQFERRIFTQVHRGSPVANVAMTKQDQCKQFLRRDTDMVAFVNCC